MVAEQSLFHLQIRMRCSLAKISMVAEHDSMLFIYCSGCSLAKISMVAEQLFQGYSMRSRCSLAKISMVAEHMLLSTH